MNSMCNFTIAGTVAEKPELRTTKTNKSVMNLRVQTYFQGKPAGTYRLTMWEEIACRFEKIGVGDGISAKGYIRNGRYEKDGVTRYTTEFVVNEADLVVVEDTPAVPENDDIPF